MLGKRIAYDANLQYAGFHTKWEQLVVRGRLDSDSYLACYVNDGRKGTLRGRHKHPGVLSLVRSVITLPDSCGDDSRLGVRLCSDCESRSRGAHCGVL